jgi:hypothetical protein
MWWAESGCLVVMGVKWVSGFIGLGGSGCLVVLLGELGWCCLVVIFVGFCLGLIVFWFPCGPEAQGEPAYGAYYGYQV